MATEFDVELALHIDITNMILFSNILILRKNNAHISSWGSRIREPHHCNLAKLDQFSSSKVCRYIKEYYLCLSWSFRELKSKGVGRVEFSKTYPLSNSAPGIVCSSHLQLCNHIFRGLVSINNHNAVALSVSLPFITIVSLPFINNHVMNVCSFKLQPHPSL